MNYCDRYGGSPTRLLWLDRQCSYLPVAKQTASEYTKRPANDVVICNALYGTCLRGDMRARPRMTPRESA